MRAIDGSQIADWSRQAGWDVDYQQVGRGGFDAWFSAATCGRLTLTDQFCNRDLVIRGCPPSGTVAIVLSSGTAGIGAFQGTALRPNDAVVLRPDDGRILRSIPDLRICTVSVPHERLESALWCHGRCELSQVLPESRSVTLSPVLTRFLAGTVSAVTAMGVESTDRAAVLEIEDQIVQAAAEGLCALAPNPRNNHRGLRDRVMYVRSARDYIEAHFKEGVRISQVAASIGITTRTLEFAFREVLGVTPLTYLRTRRLNRVRQRLVDKKSEGKTLAALAMENGMFHLGNFSRDYKLLFGELPSETLRRAGHGDRQPSNPVLVR